MWQWWKAFVVVAVTLPISAYVVATLGAAPAEPAPPAPVVLREPSEQSATPQPRPTPSRGVQGSERDLEDGPEDSGDDDDRDGDDDVSVVTPSPKRVGEDDGTDDARESDDDDDTTDGGGDT